ncbi:hypothetical protein LIER_39610 [Lithospermum erythrorhizon]|uniref:Uncharacterized protein n=1 Tax=Lithospermum erythrorhizon TaxID=34254 RepID=A0AAV3QK05_LITER
MATLAFKSTSKRATEASTGRNPKILRRSRSTTGAVNRDEARGRSVKRNSKTGIGRSVSRVRGRSVSRTHYGAYESEKENLLISADARKRTEQKQVENSGKSSSLTRSQTDVMGESLSSQRRKRGQTGCKKRYPTTVHVMNRQGLEQTHVSVDGGNPKLSGQ